MIKRLMFVAATAAMLSTSALAQAGDSYDLLIDNGTIYDGMGGTPFTGDVAIRGDRIVYVGPQARPASTCLITSSSLPQLAFPACLR